MSVTDRPVHVTKRALAYLLGRLKGVLEAPLPFGELACGGINPYKKADGSIDWGLAGVEWVNEAKAIGWTKGETLRLPTCPRCAVLWDEAVAQVDPPQYAEKS